MKTANARSVRKAKRRDGNGHGIGFYGTSAIGKQGSKALKRVEECCS